MTRRRGGVGPAVISVIGPDQEQVREVVSGLRTRLPGYRLVVGAGPDMADGVIAVASDTGQDAGILRAVRDAMGGCVLYTRGTLGSESALDADPALVHEPGVTVVRWRSTATAATDLDQLAHVAESLWVDIPRWISDARRVDADRIDRVRVAVRLEAETYAAELLSSEVGAGSDGPLGVPRTDAATAEGRHQLSVLFRAKLRCLVLEQGVEWPHLAERGERGAGASVSGALDSGAGLRAGVAERARENRMPVVLILVMSLGAGLAVAAAVSRLMGPGLGLAAGVVSGGVLAMIRWRMLSRSRRVQDSARGVAVLRRQWGAEATEVVARLRILPVAEAIAREVGA